MDVIILLYDLTNKNTLFNLQKWYKDSNDVVDLGKKIMIMVGNKSDKIDEIQVSSEDIKDMSVIFNCKTMSISCKSYFGLNYFVNTIKKEFLRNQRESNNNDKSINLGNVITKESNRDTQCAMEC
mmetsp:Transcript_39659/g.33491  ORF Transcript_39659/g.33491 Transcript_39659/m.33491 type:complete len:125 (+) Transcript_39659:261-635(+)